MTENTRRLSGILTGFAMLLVACGGNDGPTGPDRSDLEIRIVSGEDQFAPPGETLAEPLVVQVRDRIDLDPESGVRVDWMIAGGAGAVLSRESTVTDAQGKASVTLTLGSAPGDYRVMATFEGLTTSPATFQARAVATPVIRSLPDGPVQAGQVMTIEGENFSSVASENLVLFSGIRGRVESASSSQLEVRVPPCLPTRRVEVSAGFGSVRSASVSLDVEAAGEPLTMDVGDDRTTMVLEGLACLKLPAGTRWMAVPHSAGRSDGSVFRFELTGLLGADSSIAGVSPRPGAAASVTRAGRGLEMLGGGAQTRWEGTVRELERGLAPIGPRERREAAVSSPVERVPQVGDRRDFAVLNEAREFDHVTAEVVLVGDHVVMYRDLDAPENGLTSADYRAMADDFDEVIYPTDTQVFGSPSDLDGNQRIVILFTPVVNQLTEPGSEGFVGGFFFGIDLLPDRENSNGGEIFYTIVADPAGEFGDPRSRDLIVRVVPGILAHEFQHMINFNQRVLIRNGDFTDALWVSEGMALMAEDVVGEAFEEAGDSAKGVLYKVGNWARARRFLTDPGAASLVATQGGGSLEERGSWWLFFRYLRGQRGNNSVLSQLTQTTRTGVSNVEAVTGRGWSGLVADWSGAIVLDDQGFPVRDGLQFTDLALRATIDRLENGWPLSPPILGGSDFHRTGSLVASSPVYFELRPALQGGSVRAMALNLAGPNGGAPREGSDLQLTLVRIQ